MRTLIVLALLVVAGLVAYTWTTTGEVGLWPGEPTAEEAELDRLRDRLDEVEGKIRAIERQASISPDAAVGQADELERLEDERRELREQIEEAEER